MLICCVLGIMRLTFCSGDVCMFWVTQPVLGRLFFILKRYAIRRIRVCRERILVAWAVGQPKTFPLLCYVFSSVWESPPRSAIPTGRIRTLLPNAITRTSGSGFKFCQSIFSLSDSWTSVFGPIPSVEKKKLPLAVVLKANPISS